MGKEIKSKLVCNLHEVACAIYSDKQTEKNIRSINSKEDIDNYKNDQSDTYNNKCHDVQETLFVCKGLFKVVNILLKMLCSKLNQVLQINTTGCI